MSEDSLEPLVTQCPNCDTRFRVTETQLQVASGRVRCGACLAVFEGTAHLSIDGEEVAEGDSDVDALLEELATISEAEPGEPPSLPVIDRHDLAPLSQTDLLTHGPDDEVPDELLALEAELLAELRLAEPDLDDDAEDRDAEDDEAGSGEVDDGDADEDEDEVDSGEADDRDEDDVDKRDADDDVGEEDEGEEGVDVSTEPVDSGKVVIAESFDINVDEVTLDEIAADIWQHSDASDTEADDSQSDLQVESADEQDETIELQALGGLSSQATSPAFTRDEVELEDEDEQTKRSWPTLSFIVLALIGLPAQVLWFQYDAWVIDADYRPIYQGICDVAGCELPPMRDVSRIVSKKSVIRAHPERQNAHIVDVLMVNDADFAQPYPLIELTATSMRGQLVARRQFTPAEYLRGDASGSDLLPPLTPVHVSLEIQDPGDQALNFEVRFR